MSAGDRPPSWLSRLLVCGLQVLAPECCAACGRRRGRLPWADGLPGSAPGLHAWHAAHCCRDCLDGWRRAPLAGISEGVPLWAARRGSAAHGAVYGAWKYRRQCGLVRPLAELLVPVLQAAAAAAGPAILIPLPLHRRRRRERGFDQTLQLTVLAARAAALPVGADILTRRRWTRQQASQVVTGTRRQVNVHQAFVARPPRENQTLPVAVVDDLVTTGATLGAAVDALRQAGWRVAWGAALGLAARLSLDNAGGDSVAAPAADPAVAAGCVGTGRKQP